MPIHRIKHTFTAGELSPMMNVRADFERYKNGCKVLKNMTCATQGPAIRRTGFKFLHDISSLSVASQKKYAFPWTRVDHTETGAICDEVMPSGGFSYRLNPEFFRISIRDQNGDDRTTVLDQLTDNTLFSCIQKSDPDKYLTGACYTPEVCPDPDGFYHFGFHSAAIGPGGPIVVGEECTLHFTIHAPEMLQPTEPYRLVPFVFDEDTSYVLIFCAIKHIPGYAPTGGMLMFVAWGDGLVTIAGEPIYLSAINSTDSPQLPNGGEWDIARFDYAQSGDELYIAQKCKGPCAIVRESHDTWILREYTYTDQPDEWTAPCGWPTKITFHQQRLAYASSRWHPTHVWLSKAGDFHDFGIHEAGDSLPDDSVTFRLASGNQDKIQWMLSAKALNLGTSASEWTVTGATEFALTPKNILAQRQTNNGGEWLKPIMVGITTIFVEQHGRVINEFVYDYSNDGYKTSDLAILSPHITEKVSIKDWTYQQTPDSIIWTVLEDGTLAAITYQRQHKVIGWHRHDTRGWFLNVASIPGLNREDSVYTLVKREWKGPGGGYRVYLERLDQQFTFDFAQSGRFLDSFLLYHSTPVNVIHGLDHLEGWTVDVLANGTVHPPVQVAGGDVHLNSLYSIVVLGLPYVSEVRPFVADAGLADGTTFGRTQRVTNIDIDLYRSGGMYIGRDDQDDGEHEEEHPFRVPANNMDEQVPLYTGIKHIAFPEGFDRKTDYFIRQYQPLPLTVRGVIDTIEVYE